ncbi:Gfo/Idh/MocA family oxidoreductase [Flavobacteriaceae bacterium TP-CH-4]|uniref:Gfo/Idh/MocA family oxidoreductase n=1 Tax=Pelagihabitans pacificus TaxID=2696054 RepID=A0A967ECW6_9FLAO|nr:Gfo/Idh/MocA family oxidoreductase [Pelagihabitans pacificus]NHF58713.1 Gfo/Idh/MocA family oxidoreductase [Pelagihabitans pacificus]
MDKKSNTIRWGIIGCGDVTEIKSGPAYQQASGFELVAVMRRDGKKAADYAKRHGVPIYYTNAEDLIYDDRVDAVYIATPPDTHRLYALKVAEAGKPCCVEKPMAPSYADSLEIYRAFDEKKLPLFVAYYRRSLPRFEQVREWLREGQIGTPRHVRWQLVKPPSELDKGGTYNWRTDVRIAPGGYFDDLASHGLDLFVYLLGEIETAKGIALNQQGLYTAKDAVTGCWVHQGEITGEGSWNFGGHEHRDEVEIIGSQGTLRFAIFHDKPLTLQNQQGIKELEIAHPRHIQEFHVKNMVGHLKGENVHPSLGASGLHTSWVMDSILGTL